MPKLDATVRGFKMIIEGELDNIPERFFMYKGSIEEVKAAFDKEGETK